MKIWRICIGLIIFLLCAEQLNAADQKPGGDTILILDASGSMWAQINGEAKIVIAKRIVDGLLQSWPDGRKMGLMAYGHRRKEDCSDIELLSPVGPLDKGGATSTINGLQAKGRTPLADSLKLAAGQFPAGSKAPTIILVSDGIESCGGDPCAVAEALKKNNVTLVANVIGFDISDAETKAQLSCIADKTGGRYFDAKDASSLQDGLTKAEAINPPDANAKPAQDITKKVQPDPYNLRVSLRLSAQTDVITDSGTTSAPHYQLFKPGATPDTVGDEVKFTGTDFAPKMQATVPPGSYVLQVSYGEVKKRQPLTIEAGKPLKMEMVLDAGVITSAEAMGDGKPNSLGQEWQLYAAKDDGSPGEKLDHDYALRSHFVVPVGHYLIGLQRGSARVLKPVKVEAGDTLDLAVEMTAGILNISASLAAGGPPVTDHVSHLVFALDKMGGETGDQIAAIYASPTQFALSPGLYRAQTTVGNVVNMTDVEIKAKTTLSKVIDLEAGYAVWSGPALQTIEFRKAGDQDDATPVDKSYQQVGQLCLPAGAYHALIIYSDGTKKIQNVTIIAGKTTEMKT